MGKNKLARFHEIKSYSHVVQPQSPNDFPLRGNWAQHHFGNTHPLVLELGCGKGEYTVGLARRNSDINYVGVDVKGARIWRGARTVHEQSLPNAAFLRTRLEFVDHFFAPNEVSEIWLTFSDPQLKDKRGTKRLTHPGFLERYARFLKPGGIIHLKTDSTFLFAYTRGVIDALGARLLYTSHNIYGPDFIQLEPYWQDVLSIETFYESQFRAKGLPIQYLRFQLPEKWPIR